MFCYMDLSKSNFFSTFCSFLTLTIVYLKTFAYLCIKILFFLIN